MRRFWQHALVATVVMMAAAVAAANAQPPVARPQPPPPVQGTQKPAAPSKTPPSAQAPAPQQQPATQGQGAAETRPAQPGPGPAPGDPGPPPAAARLNAPVFPNAQYLGSYDAGQGQTFYLYGSTTSFADVVTYYRNVLKDRGELVFDEPATHMFEVGKFRESDVAFPPGVTIKDYTWGGSPGYLNPRAGGSPAYFRTVIQIVPPPVLSGGSR